jgi:heptosyltransferase-2
MQKFLVVAPSWVGDCMLMQPMLLRLKQRFPICQIDVLAPPWTEKLLRQIPEISDVIINPFPHGALHLGDRYRLGKQLRAAKYAAAYVLPNSLKSALVPFFANIPLRVGFIGEMRYGLLNDARKLDKITLPLMVERFVHLAEARNDTAPVAFSQPRLSVSDDQLQQTLAKFSLTPNQPIAVFCPGAEYGPAKRWPVAYYAELAKQLAEKGYQVWLIGSPKDQPVGDEIVALSAGHSLNLCGVTDLFDAIALLSCANLVISNDSGLMHIAAALDRPLLAIFGSSSPQFTPPLSAQAQVLSLNLSCSPCFKRDCPLGHFNCMKQLTPSEVAKHIPILSEH